MTGHATGADLVGRTVVITGASSGIGAAAARRLAARGTTVVPVGRSPTRTTAVAEEIGESPLVADFTRLDQVRQLARDLLERCPRIDVLVNNAGALFGSRLTTADGHERTFQVNHLAPFMLTVLLLDRLRETARDSQVRVITTSSLGNRFGKLRMDDLNWERRRYGGGWIVYSTTKLMNVLFTRELARRTDGTGIEAVCVHPDPGRGRKGEAGPDVATNLFSDTRLGRMVARVPGLRGMQLTGADGAAPLVWLVTAREVTGASGTYFDGYRPGAKVHRLADDPRLAAELWDRSADLVSAYL